MLRAGTIKLGIAKPLPTYVMALLDRAIQWPRGGTARPKDSYDHLDGPLLRAMTPLKDGNTKASHTNLSKAFTCRAWLCHVRSFSSSQSEPRLAIVSRKDLSL